MRHLVFSDVHGNLEAFTAMIESASKDRAGARLFLGDIVGYGADPSACVSAIRKFDVKVAIAGNHDWGVLGLLGIDYFNEYAAAALEWTKKRLSDEDAAYLKSFGLVYEWGDITLVHGSLDKPSRFRYVRDREDAATTMRHSRTALSFLGHTHVPGIYRMDKDGVTFTGGPKIFIEKGRKYIINAGSVGQPRDGDPRGSYVIYDDDELSVEIKRFSYDIALAREKIRKAGLPAWLASRLSEGR